MSPWPLPLTTLPLTAQQSQAPAALSRSKLTAACHVFCMCLRTNVCVFVCRGWQEHPGLRPAVGAHWPTHNTHRGTHEGTHMVLLHAMRPQAQERVRQRCALITRTEVRMRAHTSPSWVRSTCVPPRHSSARGHHRARGVLVLDMIVFVLLVCVCVCVCVCVQSGGGRASGLVGGVVNDSCNTAEVIVRGTVNGKKFVVIRSVKVSQSRSQSRALFRSVDDIHSARHTRDAGSVRRCADVTV